MHSLMGRNLKQDRANKSDGEVAAETPWTTDAAFKLMCSPVCGWSPVRLHLQDYDS